MSKDGFLTHRGQGECGCVLWSYHIVDALGEEYGLTYDERMAGIMLARRKKEYSFEMKIAKRPIVTIARHPDIAGAS